MPFQEFMIMPTGAYSFRDAMKIGSEVYQELKAIIKKRHGQFAISVGDEGGFTPNISSVYECLNLIMDAIRAAGYESQVKIALDVAASEFHMSDNPGHYNLSIKDPSQSNPQILSGQELAQMYADLVQKYPSMLTTYLQQH